MESLTKASTAYMLCELGFDTVDSWLSYPICRVDLI